MIGRCSVCALVRLWVAIIVALIVIRGVYAPTHTKTDMFWHPACDGPCLLWVEPGRTRLGEVTNMLEQLDITYQTYPLANLGLNVLMFNTSQRTYAFATVHGQRPQTGEYDDIVVTRFYIHDSNLCDYDLATLVLRETNTTRTRVFLFSLAAADATVQTPRRMIELGENHARRGTIGALMGLCT